MRRGLRSALALAAGGAVALATGSAAEAKVDSQRFRLDGDRGKLITQVTRVSPTALRVETRARIRVTEKRVVRLWNGCEAVYCNWDSKRFRLRPGLERIRFAKIVRGRAYISENEGGQAGGQPDGGGGSGDGGLIPGLPDLPDIPGQLPPLPVDVPPALPRTARAGRVKADVRAAQESGGRGFRVAALPVFCAETSLREPGTHRDVWIRKVCV